MFVKAHDFPFSFYFVCLLSSCRKSFLLIITDRTARCLWGVLCFTQHFHLSRCWKQISIVDSMHSYWNHGLIYKSGSFICENLVTDGNCLLWSFLPFVPFETIQINPPPPGVLFNDSDWYCVVSMIVWLMNWGMKWQGKFKCLEENCPIATSSTTIPT